MIWAVIDTGVAISAVLLPRSIPRQAFDLALARGAVLVSEATIAELDDVLRRPKFDEYITQKDRLEFLAALIQETEVVEVTEHIRVCRDPTDDKFLELAISGAASHIVSSDAELLVLNPFRGIPILTPRAFVENLSRA
jgi:putative PIN family toxin of toxin-antitoxin system